MEEKVSKKRVVIPLVCFLLILCLVGFVFFDQVMSKMRYFRDANGDWYKLHYSYHEILDEETGLLNDKFVGERHGFANGIIGTLTVYERTVSDIPVPVLSLDSEGAEDIPLGAYMELMGEYVYYAHTWIGYDGSRYPVFLRIEPEDVDDIYLGEEIKIIGTLQWYPFSRVEGLEDVPLLEKVIIEKNMYSFS